MDVHRSAGKHGIDATDAVHAAERYVYAAPLDDESPAREFRLGFDAAARLLEIVVLRFDSGNELIIHAMPARSQYLDLVD
ncbi:MULTISPECIES: toxin [unclassified Curtobacterium]|uniref:toxin n=1 Tax=unclassified Curtobacterium TaxID=257496 RepID=UPI000DA87119|nr:MULTISPECIES: toxin [unclassified Curtobacterium]PZE27236.1 toxin [Curtobacterium sp. MCBD17_028]PZF60248.1 toxin [Curtobacterium sp. MCBD17_034]PZM34933.1 toxin [Curtobacterium sp. MCBD17_031]WIE54330.1 toxin [Curtobacterium sp. MCBD17_003]